MTIVVVLSTYNGENYIQEQLDSLQKQTRKPEAVVIRDDCSTDKTVEIINNFIKKNNLSNWKFEVNEKNVGWRQNFRELILSSSEDLIFPCDQDDIWHPTKIEEMAGIMEAHCEIDLLACGYEPLYEDNTRHITTSILKNMNNTKRLEKINLNEKFMHVLRPGCTFALRHDFCQLIASEWDVTIPHDAMVWRSAIIKGTAFIYQHNLITWRRYNSSSSNPNRNVKKKSDRFKILFDERTSSNTSHLLYINCLNHLISQRKLNVDEKTQRLLETSYEFETKHKEAMLTHNPIRIFIIDFKFRKFLLTLKTILSDIYIALKTV